MQVRVSALTDLDICVLAVILRRGPMSAYAVRKEFSDSPTPTWSASTGSIYPSIKRLIRAGTVIAGATEDERGKRLLRASDEGRDRFNQWLQELGPTQVGPSADLIRTKVQFLSELDEADRQSFVANAIEATKVSLDGFLALKRQMKAKASYWELVGMEGAIFELRAREAWLRSITPSPRD